MNTLDPHKNELSKARLAEVHPKLRVLFEEVPMYTRFAFYITEGIRTHARQKQLYDAGASRTLKSKHITGHAVDVAIFVGTEIRWDWPLYRAFAMDVKHCAQLLSIPITWGGDWPKFRDGPHYELKLDKQGNPL